MSKALAIAEKIELLRKELNTLHDKTYFYNEKGVQLARLDPIDETLYFEEAVVLSKQEALDLLAWFKEMTL